MFGIKSPSQNKVNNISVSGNLPSQIRCSGTIAASATSGSVVYSTLYPYNLSSGVSEVLIPLDEFWHVIGMQADTTYTPNFAIGFSQNGTMLPSMTFVNTITTSATNPYKLGVSVVLVGGKTMQSFVQTTAANGSTAVDYEYTITIVKEHIG